MFSEGFGGITTTFIYNEVKYFSKKHDLLYLCNFIKKDSDFKYVNVKEIPYNWKSLKQKILWRLWNKDIYFSMKEKSFSEKLNRILNEFKPDIIHCHFGYDAVKILDNINKTNIPVIIHFHGYGASKMMKKQTYVKKIKKYLSEKNIYPIFVTKHFLNRFKENNIDTSRHFLLYYGTDTSFFKRNSRDRSKNIVTFLQVSSLVEKKGHEYTLKAFEKFINKEKNKNFELIFTGDGKRKTELENLSKTLGISKYVKFVGNVSHNEAKELMENADVFVHHSITAKNGDQEGIPNAVMEAMAMELPVLSTFHSGIPELVENNVNGFLVKEKDVETYAEKMKEILSWGYKPENRQKIIDLFEYNKHNKQLEDFYKNLIK